MPIKSTQEDFNDSELVIGLVGPIGVDFDHVTDLLESQLKVFSYHVQRIRISKLIIPRFNEFKTEGLDDFQRIQKLMNAGDRARAKTKDNSILAKGVAAVILSKREKIGHFNPRVAHIIQSLKHPDEVNRLKMIYPHGFYLIGVNSSVENRKSYLVNRKSMTAEQAMELIDRDKGDRIKSGQHTSDAFQLADFFINLDETDKVDNAVNRMIKLLFGYPFHTPYFDEYAMYLAFTASLRSADLSRQVGAVVARDSEILSLGANDCPRYGGGLYWPEEKPDGSPFDVEEGRDYMRGFDANKDQQQKIINGICEAAMGKKVIKKPSQLRNLLLKGPIGDLIEFGRIIHAEMDAILTCGRRGIKTTGATLYCTTFPCHNCVKHIVAAGIHRVVYIEPYPKSKAFELHRDTVSEDAKNKNIKVILEPFVGVSPHRFFDLFSLKLGHGWKLRRKYSDGKKVDWSPNDAKLRVQMIPMSYLRMESIAASDFEERVSHGRKTQKTNRK